MPAPVKIFGDVHGQLRSLLLLFGAFGFPSHAAGDVQATAYIFNGDWVDRGRHQLEVVALLFALKLIYPERIVLIRGNHEHREMNALMGNSGFRHHCESRLPPERWHATFEQIHQTFDMLPLGARVSGSVLVLHGGVGDGTWNLEQLQSTPRPLCEFDDEAHRAAFQALWSDPSDSDDAMRRGVHASPRGKSVPQFGPDVTRAFCERNDVRMIIRSHQYVKEGFKVMHAGRLVTVFSARDYFVDVDLSGTGNDGAMLLLAMDCNGHLRIHPKRIASCESALKVAMAQRQKQQEEAKRRALLMQVAEWLFTCGGLCGVDDEYAMVVTRSSSGMLVRKSSPRSAHAVLPH